MGFIMKYIDLHCDTLMKCYLDGISLRENDAQIDLARLEGAGAMAQCMAVFVPTDDIAREYGVELSPGDYFDACAEVYRRELEVNADLVRPALCVQDIIDNGNSGRVSTILTLENGVVVDGKLERLDELFEIGVRLVTLTWNYENCFGFPQSDDAEAMKLGLKPFGIEAVWYMNELGVVVDVSHLSEGGFDDVARYSVKPFAASHSCSRALCDVGRNLTDRQLKALGDRGGVCGVNFAPMFLEKGSAISKTDAIVRHIRHIADHAGTEAVALGSDFDGFPGEVELGGCSGMPLLVDALRKEFHECEVEKICYGNALRLFSDVFV